MASNPSKRYFFQKSYQVAEHKNLTWWEVDHFNLWTHVALSRKTNFLSMGKCILCIYGTILFRVYERGRNQRQGPTSLVEHWQNLEIKASAMCKICGKIESTIKKMVIVENNLPPMEEDGIPMLTYHIKIWQTKGWIQVVTRITR